MIARLLSGRSLSYPTGGRFRVNLLFFPLLAASILGNYYREFTAAYLCALLHELGHAAAARCLGVSFLYIEIQPFGVCIKLNTDKLKTPRQEILIAAAGPAVSLCLAAASPYLPLPCSDMYFFYCNISMAAINLLPALPLDGGRILKAVLSYRFGSVRAYNLTVSASKLPIALLLLLSVYGLLTMRFNLSLILISAFLLSNLACEQNNISRGALREIIGSREKLASTTMLKTGVLTARADTPARHILRELNISRFHIVNVTDKNGRIIRTLSETQLLDAMSEKGVRITLSDV